MEQPPSATVPEHARATQAGAVERYSDEFMMYVFKVEMCRRVDKHDREKCPYAHPGELARRRHPSLYKALPCPEARAKKICPRLENCTCSHSTFEFWLHPDRYKTFLCERGAHCDRPVCFFAHSEAELRELPEGVQRTESKHKPAHFSYGRSRVHHGGASSSRHAAAGTTPGQADSNVLAQEYMQQPGYLPQQSGSEEHGQGLARYAPGLHQPQQQLAALPQGLQYVAVQGQPQPDTAAVVDLGSHSVLLQPGQVLHASAIPVAEGQRQPEQTAHALQGPQYQQQAPVAYTMQPGTPLYGSTDAYHGQQMLVGYQPMQQEHAGGYAGAPGVVMIRPPKHRGTTVAVIPAGPSTWSNAEMSATDEAPSLEALCAALHHQIAFPAGNTPAAQTQQTASQHYQQAQPGSVMQQIPGQSVPALFAGQAVLTVPSPQLQLQVQQQQPGLPGQPAVYAAAVPGAEQLLAGQQQQQPQIGPGQPVMVVLPPTAGNAGQVQWGGSQTQY